jgi:hypothetical protein
MSGYRKRTGAMIGRWRSLYPTIRERAAGFWLVFEISRAAARAPSCFICLRKMDLQADAEAGIR